MAKREIDAQKIELARRFRRQQTPAERVLWNSLRSSQEDGSRFRRQHPIGNYIADFVNLENKLIVEIDGGQHDENNVRRKDEKRTQWLESEGYRVLRFWNNDVLMNLDGVWLRIQEELQQKSSPSS